MSDLDRIVSLAPTTLDRFRLDGKVAIVVGGTRGLGQAMALALAAAGADVCVVGRDPRGLADTSRAICDLGRRGTQYAADVTEESQVQAMVGYAESTYARIDILVNSQGIVALHPIEDFDAGEWQRVIDVNVKSVFLCCKHVARVMLKQGRGKIINISSVRSFQGRLNDAAYAPSKGAVNQLTHSMAIEWGPRGVNVNALAPVFTRTAMSAPVLDNPQTMAWVLSRIAMKRVGELDDLFGPIVFLASDASNFVNGHVLVVDGGWLST